MTESCRCLEAFSVFRLGMHIPSLEMHIFSLEMYILRLEIQNFLG